MIYAIGCITALGLLLGLGLALASRYLQVEGDPLAEQIEALMPGSQCGQCGYPGCAPAAAAVAAGEAPVTLCPPGGKTLAHSLAEIMGMVIDLSTVQEKAPQLAWLNEETCIGCTRCYKACPTDAIIGAAKQIHGVIRDACTGCEQCAEICPTESIVMRPLMPTLQTWHYPLPSAASSRQVA